MPFEKPTELVYATLKAEPSCYGMISTLLYKNAVYFGCKCAYTRIRCLFDNISRISAIIAPNARINQNVEDMTKKNICMVSFSIYS